MRLIGYIRVSQVRGREGDSFISPDVQRDRIEGIARARGHAVVEWIEDLDQSGAKTDRPGFQHALSLVEQGVADGVAVAKLDRFARSTIDTEMSVRRLEAAGGALVCGDIDLDTTTPTGKLMRTMLAALAEFELDRIRENWRTSTQRHIARGAHHGRPPTGYQKRPDGTLEPNDDADLVRQVFALRSDGASWLEIRAAVGGKWSRSTLSTMVANPTYLGTVRAGEFELTGAHEALVDRATWEAVQSKPVLARRSVHGSLLAGLLVCDSCDQKMAVNRDGKRGYANYGCRKHYSGWTCDSPAKISVLRADAHITEMFLEWIDAGLAASGEPRTHTLEPLVGDLEQAEAELAIYRDEEVLSIIGRDAYMEGLQERADRVNVARGRVADERQRSNLTELGQVLNVTEDWPTLELEEKRSLLIAGIEEVRCTVADLRGQGSTPADRLRVHFRGTDYLPVQVGPALAANLQ